MLVPGDWTVKRGHALLENIERELRRAVPSSTVFTHLEAVEDPASFVDMGLDRLSSVKDPGAEGSVVS